MKALAIGVIAALIGTAGPAAAQDPAAAPAGREKTWDEIWKEKLQTDYGFWQRYREENAALPQPAANAEPRIVFLGDSITEGWRDKMPAFFTANRIGRGIGGQTTPQMVARFRQDVIDLHPAVVQIMAGTNDIAGNTGPMSFEDTVANFRTMTELAQAHGIRVILASVPPADHFPWRPGLETASKIARINAWLQDYARETGSTYADYWTALKGQGQELKPEYTYDGVHPDEDGYRVMAPVAERAIREALRRPAPKPLAIAAAK